MTALLVRHALFDRRAEAVHQRIHGLDDEEEDGSGDGDERDQVRKEGAVVENGVIDREGQIAKVGLPDDHRDHRHEDVVDERVDERPKATPITNATASSTMLPRKRKSRNSLNI
jgi:hypothetical protein